MEMTIIAPLYLNFTRFVKNNNSNFSKNELFDEIKILMLRTNRLLTSIYHLPSIKVASKNNLKHSITECIERLAGANYQGILKITELNVFNVNKDQLNQKSLSLEMVFMKTDEIKPRFHTSGISPEFISILETSKINISEQSKEYFFHIKKWIEKECVSMSSLQKWFKSSYNDTVSITRQDCFANLLNPEIKQKSTSLDTINSYKLPRPQSADIELSNKKKQADSLDQLMQKYDKKLVSNTVGLKMILKSNVMKSKPSSNIGPVAAIPVKDTRNENLVINNPLTNSSLNHHFQTDIVIENPFWNKRKPDYNQISKKAKTLFKVENVLKNRCWSNDYPLHFASHKGYIYIVDHLIDTGYNCMQKDRFGWTPIHYAVWYGHKEIVELLIKSDSVAINVYTTDMLTPLHLSIFRENSDMAEILIKQPDINISLSTCKGDDSWILAERTKQLSIISLLKLSGQKSPSKLSVHLMDGSIKEVILNKGMDTTFQHLKNQMIDVLNIPHNCSDIFNFWVGCKSTKLSGKYSIIPIQCFGDIKMSIKDLNLEDFKLYWKRNIFLNLESERRVKDITVISLLFEEALQNFTKKSLYPCDSKDVILLCSVLLDLHLSQDPNKSTKVNRRALSLSRLNRPLSSMFSSNPDVSNANVSSSIYVSKDLSLPKSNISENRSLDRPSIIELKKCQAKQFLSYEKNIALITPKKKYKSAKINFSEDILAQFLSSTFSQMFHSTQEIKFRFLTLCWNLTLYGCAYFDVEIKLQTSLPFINCIFAINDMGIYIMHCKSNTLIQNFKYSSVNWINNAETKCLRVFSKKTNIVVKSKYSSIITQLMLSLQTMNPR